MRLALQLLLDRLPEIAWYAKQHQLVAEPGLYPKGLFRCTHNTPQYAIEIYLDEIKKDILMFDQLTIAKAKTRLGQLIQQKINVLVNSFHSAHLRKTTYNPLESLLLDVENSKTNAFDYFCRKVNQDRLAPLQKDKKTLLAQKKAMEKTLQLKTRQMHREKEKVARDKTQHTILQLQKELGALEKQLRLNEELWLSFSQEELN